MSGSDSFDGRRNRGRKIWRRHTSCRFTSGVVHRPAVHHFPSHLVDVFQNSHVSEGIADATNYRPATHGRTVVNY